MNTDSTIRLPHADSRLLHLCVKGAWSKSSKAELVGLLCANGWDEPWYGHVYPWQHYHDTTWEALVRNLPFVCDVLSWLA